MSINRGMDKEDVVCVCIYIYILYMCVCVCVCVCNVILLSHNKEQNKAICSNLNGPRDCHNK